MAKKGGGCGSAPCPPLFASYRRAYAFFSPASPERLRNGIPSDFVRLPHPYSFRRLRVAALFELMEMRRGEACCFLHSFRAAC